MSLLGSSADYADDGGGAEQDYDDKFLEEPASFIQSRSSQ